MGYPRTLAALREQEDRSWAVADALVAELPTHPDGRVLNGEYDRCRAWLASQGYEVTVNYLQKMRLTAAKFLPSEGRKWNLPFRLYMEAAGSAKWTPGLMEQAELNHWSLRQFSEALTGRPWADDDTEAVRRVFSDPDKASRALAAMPAAQRGEIAREVLADPEAANAAFARTDHMRPGSDTSRALGNISQARNQGERQRQAERQAATPPAAREFDRKIGQTGAKLDLDEATLAYKIAAREFAEKVSAALPQAGPYQGSDGPMSLAELVRQTAEVHATAGRLLEMLHEYTTGNQPGSSLDDELARLTGGA